MKDRIIKCFKILLVVILSAIALFIIIMPEKSLNVVDNLLHSITGNYYFSDENEKINKDDVIKIAKNKDYSNSIFYPYFELLNDNQKLVYKDIIENVNKYSEKFNINVKIDDKELNDTFISVLYDHPELFWLDSTYSMLINPNNTVENIQLHYLSYVDDIDNAKKTFNDEIDAIVAAANTKSTDYEKELYVHDTLANILEYDENNDSNLNTYDAIVNKKAICDGYTKLFQIIMTRLNIPTYYVMGNAKGNHSWNLVELDDGFYNIDLTWDDQKDRTIYTYFNLDDKTISKDHVRENLSAKLIIKNGNKYINKFSPLYK